MIIANITPKKTVSIIPFVATHLLNEMDYEHEVDYSMYGFSQTEVLDFLFETMLVYDSIDKETLIYLLIECLEEVDPWGKISEGYPDFYKAWVEQQEGSFYCAVDNI